MTGQRSDNPGKINKFLGDILENLMYVRTRCNKYGLLYHMIVQAVLLYGSETWVLTAPMFTALEGAHVGFDRVITRIIPRILGVGVWV